jgi:hypothetical protein
MSVFTNPASSSAEQAQAYTTAVLGLLGSSDPLSVLQDTPTALRRATLGMSERQLSAPEAPGKWAIRQVLRHLADSEIVWSYRLRMVLAHDRPQLTGYDQDAWANRLGYADADVAEALDTFAMLRRANLALLQKMSPQDMKRFGVHAERGEESVEHMVKLYAGHDVLHLRQIERIRAAIGG